jgi:hypothetical protein
MKADSSIFWDREKARSLYRLGLSLFLISLLDFALFGHLLFVAHIGLCVLLTSFQAMVGSDLEVLFLLFVCDTVNCYAF